jgi:hypothetical protein
MNAARSRYFVFVPITWGDTQNRFKVEIEADSDLDDRKIEEIKVTARKYVESRGQTIIDNRPIEIYRGK